MLTSAGWQRRGRQPLPPREGPLGRHAVQLACTDSPEMWHSDHSDYCQCVLHDQKYKCEAGNYAGALLSPTIPGVTIPRTWHRSGNSLSRASAVSVVVLFLAVRTQCDSVRGHPGKRTSDGVAGKASTEQSVSHFTPNASSRSLKTLRKTNVLLFGACFTF